MALLLAWPTVQISLAMSHGSSEDDAVAADYAHVSQAAATVAAEQRFNDGDTAGAKQLAQQALSVSPISAPALRVFGLSLQKENDLKDAGAVMSQAATLGWRDAPSQLWLTAALIQNKTYGEAANHLDAALRTTPNSPQLFQLVDTIAASPQMVQPVVNRLVLRPDWRTIYLADLTPGTPETARARAAVLQGLMRSIAPPSPDEIAPVVKRLYQAGLAGDSRNLWLTSNKAPATPLYDGTFIQTQNGHLVPFAWMLRPVGGATVEPVQRNGVKGQALHVTVDGMTAATLAQQSTLLPPGGHRFEIGAAGTQLDAFHWVVRCAPKGATLLTLPAAAPLSAGNFTVPAGCGEQLVSLQSQAGTKHVASEAWFSQATIH